MKLYNHIKHFLETNSSDGTPIPDALVTSIYNKLIYQEREWEEEEDFDICSLMILCQLLLVILRILNSQDRAPKRPIQSPAGPSR